jgi:hypothetical protein
MKECTKFTVEIGWGIENFISQFSPPPPPSATPLVGGAADLPVEREGKATDHDRAAVAHFGWLLWRSDCVVFLYCGKSFGRYLV